MEFEDAVIEFAAAALRSAPCAPEVTGSKSHEEDVTALFLERCDMGFRRAGGDGLVVVAGPSGGDRSEGKFIAGYIELRGKGTEYRDLRHAPLGVMMAPTRQMGLLQLAGVVASCTAARVSGESNYSPAVFAMIKPLLRRDGSRVGGVGLKIHPDYGYANLYHWLVGNSHFFKTNTGYPLPAEGRLYHADPGEAAPPEDAPC